MFSWTPSSTKSCGFEPGISYSENRADSLEEKTTSTANPIFFPNTPPALSPFRFFNFSPLPFQLDDEELTDDDSIQEEKITAIANRPLSPKPPTPFSPNNFLHSSSTHVELDSKEECSDDSIQEEKVTAIANRPPSPKPPTPFSPNNFLYSSSTHVELDSKEECLDDDPSSSSEDDSIGYFSADEIFNRRSPLPPGDSDHKTPDNSETKLKNSMKESLKSAPLSVLDDLIFQGLRNSYTFSTITAKAAEEILYERKLSFESKIEKIKVPIKLFFRNYDNATLQKIVDRGLTNSEEFEQINAQIAQEIIHERAQMPRLDPHKIHNWIDSFSKRRGLFALKNTIQFGMHSNLEFERVYTQQIQDIFHSRKRMRSEEETGSPESKRKKTYKIL